MAARGRQPPAPAAHDTVPLPGRREAGQRLTWVRSIRAKRLMPNERGLRQETARLAGTSLA